jgi:hypothetical protein
MVETEKPPAPTDSRPLEEYKVNKLILPSNLHEQDAEKVIQAELLGNDAPDGGVVAWLVILGVWCCSFCSFGWMNSMTGSSRDEISYSTLTTTRCWRLPGVLPRQAAPQLFNQHHLVDP